MQRLRQRAQQLKAETLALYLAARHPDTPWYAKLLAAGVAAYALSPIDLIPDFIPVLGYLDDLILVPAGIALAVRLVPAEVLAECRTRAAETLAGARPVSRAATVVVIAVWIATGAFLVLWVYRLLTR